MNTYFISAKDILTTLLPATDIVLPDEGVLDRLKISPSVLFPDPVNGLRTETYVIIGQPLELALPGLDMLALSLGGTEDPVGLTYSVYPKINLLLGPVPVSFHFKNELFVPVKRVRQGRQDIGFEPDGEVEVLTIRIEESWLSYDEEDGLGLTNKFVVTIPPFMIKGTNLILGAQEAAFVLSDSLFQPALIPLGFDESFRGIYAQAATLYWLPEIKLNDFDLPGLRLDFEDTAIGNQGVSLEVGLTWEVQFDATGHFLPDETELSGYLLDEEWQIAIENATGSIRRNIPERFSVKTFLRVPFFNAIFSTYFSLAFRSQTDGSTSYQTALAINKESAAPIIAQFFDDQLVFTLNSFSAGGWLSDEGFSVSGLAGFALDIFGFVIEAQSVAIAYTHLEKSDDFQFTLKQLTLGELGTVEEARLIIKSHQNDQNKTIFDRLEIAATYIWADLQALIPPDLQEVVGLPDNGRIEVLISWEEREGQAGGARKLVVKLLTEVSHLDQLWSFIPAEFRPEVRQVRSMFKLTYDSAQIFAPKDAQGNPVPPPQTYTERSGVAVELSAHMEIRLPDAADFNLPNFELIQVDTGDEEGFITAEFVANYISDTHSGDSFQAGLAVQNPFAVNLILPGTDPNCPFIHNSLDKVGLQFAFQDGSDQQKKIGGKLLFEGQFEFKPLVPAAFPFASHFNTLMRNVGLAEVSGKTRLVLGFTEDTFDLEISGEFEQFGIELDIFRLLSTLSTSGERPSAPEIGIDFNIGFHLIGFSFKVGNGPQPGGDDSDAFYFSFSLTVECSMTGLPPLKAAITLSNTEFLFGLEDLTIPFEVPQYPIDNADLSRLQGPNGIWTAVAQQSYVAEIDAQITELETLLASTNLTEQQRFHYIKDKAHLELKKLMLEIIMAIHGPVGPDGQPIFQGLVEADTWLHATVFNFLHVETEVKLNFPEIKFRIPFDDPGGVALSGSGRLTGFGQNDPLKELENYTFSLGLSSEYIFAKIESDSAPIPIPDFGTKYDDGTVSISKFMIGYGFTKNSFAFDFAGELVIPSELSKDADTSGRLGVGVRLPQYNKLAFKIDLIPITIVKATILLPVPRFDLDLRSPNAPALTGTAVCEPYWDGFEFLIRDVAQADLKRLAFSPFFGFAIIPNLKFDGDIKLGDNLNGLTVILDDMFVLLGVLTGSTLLPIPFFADPSQPYFQNICVNLRVLGFHLNFNMQRPFPSFSPLAALEAFGLISNPMMEIDPQGSLANTIRFTLSDAYLQVPDFVLQMFPEAGNLVNKTYGFTLNLGTLITMVQSVVTASEPVIQAMSDFATGQEQQLDLLLNALPQSFDPWDWIVLLPPELRKFRMGGQIAGFEANACLVIASEAEARQALKDKNARAQALPPLNTVKEQDPTKNFITYSKYKNHLYKPTSGYQFETSWLAEGSGASDWLKVSDGILQQSSSPGTSYFVYQKTGIPTAFTISLRLSATDWSRPAEAGMVFCYLDQDNHYLLKTHLNDDGRRVITLEKQQGGQTSQLLEEVITGATDQVLHWEMITYIQGSERVFVLSHIREAAVRGRAASETATYQTSLGRSSDTGPFDSGKVGLYANSHPDVRFSGMIVYKLSLKNNDFGKLSAQSLHQGFDVNAPSSQLSDRRLVTKDESSTLFKGIEFKKFDEGHLDLIPVEKLAHIQAGQASIYLGAYLKLFEGQRFRFLGRLYADGSFALVSEAEARPLQLRVLGIPVKIPFSGYGNLIVIGRQKRNGSYGYVEANGYFDWVPLPNIMRFIVGSKSKPASLKLYSSGQFDLQAAAKIILFNGAAEIDGSVSLSNQQAAFAGRLQFTLGVSKSDYRFRNILSLDVKGVGLIESFNKYRFEGRGEVHFLGEKFTNVAVGLDEHYAFFDLHFKKPINTRATILEQLFPILTACDLELKGSCIFNMRRTVRPEFSLSGEGYIKVLGAEMRGKGEIKSLPSPNKSTKSDFFEASMEGSLLWQGRKWLGGKISVGSKGLFLSGTTNFGLNLTPKTVSGTSINIASLFLNIQLEGEFRLDVQKASLRFEFRGFWTLGAAMADTGNPNNRQMLPLASSSFTFASSAGFYGPNEYGLDLFQIDGFSFLPFKDVSIPLPTITLSKEAGATTLLKTGKINYPAPMQDQPAVEFYTPASHIGIEGVIPYLGRKDPDSWVAGSVRELYSAYDVSFGVTNLDIDFEEFSNVRLALILQNSLEHKFPMKLRLDFGGGTRDISF